MVCPKNRLGKKNVLKKKLTCCSEQNASWHPQESTHLQSRQDAGLFGIGWVTPRTRHATEALCFGVKSIPHTHHSTHLARGCGKREATSWHGQADTWQTAVTDRIAKGEKSKESGSCKFPLDSHPFRPCRRGRCRPGHCSWWWAGWRGWRALPHRHCPLSLSCSSTPHCSFRSHRTSRMSLSAYALNVGCVQPSRSSVGWDDKSGYVKTLQSKIIFFENDHDNLLKCKEPPLAIILLRAFPSQETITNIK